MCLMTGQTMCVIIIFVLKSLECETDVVGCRIAINYQIVLLGGKAF